MEKALRDRPRRSGLRRQGLYPCEAEIACRLSQSEQRWRRIAPQLEQEGLPRIDPLMRGRYWPAVKAFMDARAGMDIAELDSEEQWDKRNGVLPEGEQENWG